MKNSRSKKPPIAEELIVVGGIVVGWVQAFGTTEAEARALASRAAKRYQRKMTKRPRRAGR